MKIITVGRGNIGGGLGRLWRDAGHEVEELGRDGGDVSTADVVLIAVPGDVISDALSRVTGLEGKVAIDATNAYEKERASFPSHAHEVQSFTHAPVAKSFNFNIARLYDAVAQQRVRPSNFYAADEGARQVTEQLIRDAGYDPVRVGDLTRARGLEDAVWLLTSAVPGGGFYRFSAPGQL